METGYIQPREVRARQEYIERLVETSMGVTKGQSLTEAKGWKEIVEGIVGDERKAFVAMMLENNKQILVDRKQGILSEDTQAVQVGNWEKFGFPVISMVAENLITPELVSVQPLQGPSGNVFFMDYTVGQTKGNIKKGDPIWNSRGGHGPSRNHTSETIESEQIGLGDGSDATFEANLGYVPVRPGTVVITVGSVTVTDNGNGTLAGTGLTSGTVDYVSGAVALTFAAAPQAADVITATYDWNSEGSTNLPQMNFQISSAPIYARRHALRGRWSFEAEQMLSALHGLKAEGQISAAISAEIQFEIDREILANLWNIAGAGSNTWNATPATGTSFTEHKLSFTDAINELSMFIYRATSRVMANWVIVGVQGAAILMNHPLFDAANTKAEVDGITFLGTLNKQYKVYVDPHQAPDEYLVGYKGDNFMRTGYIFAPWLLLYSTQTIALDDLTYRKAFASQFGRKPVNSKFYAKGKILNYPTAFGGS
jgi:hypothetical protein